MKNDQPIAVARDPEMPAWAKGWQWYDDSLAGTSLPKPGGAARPGDRVTQKVFVYRKWWQFWKPKIVGERTQTYVVVEGSEAGASEGE